MTRPDALFRAVAGVVAGLEAAGIPYLVRVAGSSLDRAGLDADVRSLADTLERPDVLASYESVVGG